MQLLIAFLFFYFVIIIFFNQLVFQPKDLALAPDYVSGKVIVEASSKLDDTGPPLWTPYFFGGMPCLASLQHPLFTYPVFGWDITAKILSVLFINPLMDLSMRLMLFHFLMAGIFTYLLARSLGLSWMVGIFSGLIFMFTPQLIVLPNVGHGSKLFTASYIPLVFLAVKQMIDRRKLIDFAVAVFAIGMILLAMHVQMAFYGLLAAGMYLVWSIIYDIKEKPVRIPLKAGLFICAALLGVFFAASAYFPIYEYTPFSIRGGTEGGLAWDYATKWSFHPLESLTYIIPSFFGFGGTTYWGYMPFTDMPLYWGIAAFIFSLMAVIYARNRTVWFFIILFLFAWIVSFGSFFSILFKPMFSLMPFFNKFRVPVMIQILMVFSVAILAGFGLEKFREMAAKGKSAKWVLYAGAIVVGAAILLTILQTPFKNAISGWISSNRSNLPPQYHGELFKILFGDLWKSTLFAAAVLGAIYIYLTNKFKFQYLVTAVIVLLILDLWFVNSHLINPTPHSNLISMFQPTPAVNYLLKQKKPFRIYPLDRLKLQNWYGYYGIESIDGYMGTKMKRYQELLDGIGLNNFNVINMLNTKYILTNQDLDARLPIEKVLDGPQKVYLNKAALPRCWLVHKLMVLPDSKAQFDYMKSFNPWETAIVEEPIDLMPGEGGRAVVAEYKPLEIQVKTSCAFESFLVLSENHYPPYWHAKIDGNETKIYPTNHLLRGVKVPPGEHTIIFKCESSVYKLGWLLHYITFMGLIIIFVIYLTPKVMKLMRKK